MSRQPQQEFGAPIPEGYGAPTSMSEGLGEPYSYPSKSEPRLVLLLDVSNLSGALDQNETSTERADSHSPQVVVDNQTVTPPNTYLAFNAFVKIFCCLCIGVCGVSASREVEEAINQGDEVAAQRLSRRAKRIGMIGVLFGLLIIGLSLELRSHVL